MTPAWHRHFSRRREERVSRGAALCKRISMVALRSARDNSLYHFASPTLNSSTCYRYYHLFRKKRAFSNGSNRVSALCTRTTVRPLYSRRKKKSGDQDPADSKLFEYANHLSDGQLPQRNSSFEWGSFSLGSTWRFLGRAARTL